MIIDALARVAINELIALMTNSAVDILSDVDVFAVSVSYAVIVVLADMVIEALAGGIIGVVTTTGVEVVTGVNANVVKTDLTFALTAPLEEDVMPFRRAMLSC